jgi:hypothetical protein
MNITQLSTSRFSLLALVIVFALCTFGAHSAHAIVLDRYYNVVSDYNELDQYKDFNVNPNACSGGCPWREDEIASLYYGYGDPTYYPKNTYEYNYLMQYGGAPVPSEAPDYNPAYTTYNPVAQNTYSASYTAYSTPATAVYQPTSSSSVYDIARANLAAPTQSVQRTYPAVYQQPVQRTQQVYVPAQTYQNNSSQYSQQYTYPSVVYTGTAAQATAQTRPTCSLSPRVADNGTILLEWNTGRATVAFIDNGIGHVSIPSGTRAITPNVTTTYTMIVVSEDGLASQCSAVISVINGGQVTTNTNGAVITPNQTVDASNPLTAVVDVSGNVAASVTDKITDVATTGQGIWDKVRNVSIVAIGVILLLGLLVFIMRSMFGGGGEAAH